ncbi:MAG: bifunctional UDP-N-acetylglucosamine diphosphorylase/glucosamine-1-phosphate N-acetyltransferase GlmU [Candidatus Eremiobacteraeota bacterium]|nr:bifunctional UDP-N-acetylglucosamine diphosphorylase/glucosamine-1-phosphate N-acetyltransferase GlmU [Candidatus Eremiobacteraeota bacterium]
MKHLKAIMLAAGKSKRMKTKTPKILHPIMGKPMIDYVLDSCDAAGIEEVILVVGHEREKVMDYLEERVKYALQEEQMGTGHAVMQAMPLLEDFSGDVIILCGDMPLLSPDTLAVFINQHRKSESRVSLLTAIMGDPGKLGRIVRNKDGSVEKIVEAVDATPDELKINEVNTGTYIFDADYLREILPAIGLPNAQKEIYLTDTILISREVGEKVFAMSCPDYRESLGVNSRADMAKASKVIRERINHDLMMSGVTIYDPDNTYIEKTVEIGNDTVILPGCMIMGKTAIGSDCVIGPNSRISNSKIARGSTVVESVLNEAEVGEENSIGPFAHMRPGSKTDKLVKVGNFVEIKKSTIGEDTKISHLSYVGDATIGKHVNIGAGTITCNYDGERKHPTSIRDNVFIGSNTSLIAPVVLGEGARTGAGAVIRKDVPDWTLAVGRPARNIKKLENPDDEIMK